MARDRQRAKQRRRRQTGGSEPRGGRSPARDLGLDESGVEDAGLGGSTPAPEPLDHASADVDEARLAERGARPPRVGDDDPDDFERVPDDLDDAFERAPDDDFERAPDDVEGDLVPEEEMDPAVAEQHGRRRRPARRRSGVLGFLRSSWEELKRVQWPDRRHVGQATAVVLGFVVLAGGYLGLMDAIFKPLVNAIL
jgi:preprotein translocase SecE subunit